jgi:glutaredoxin-related protein
MYDVTRRLSSENGAIIAHTMTSTWRNLMMYNIMYIVFVRKKCKYSRNAVELLKNKKKEIVTCTDVDDMIRKIKDRGLTTPRKKTFPRVYNDKKLVGGFTELKKIKRL